MLPPPLYWGVCCITPVHTQARARCSCCCISPPHLLPPPSACRSLATTLCARCAAPAPCPRPAGRRCPRFVSCACCTSKSATLQGSVRSRLQSQRRLGLQQSKAPAQQTRRAARRPILLHSTPPRHPPVRSSAPCQPATPAPRQTGSTSIVCPMQVGAGGQVGGQVHVGGERSIRCPLLCISINQQPGITSSCRLAPTACSQLQAGGPTRDPQQALRPGEW